MADDEATARDEVDDELTREDLATGRPIAPIAALVVVALVAGFLLGRITAPDDEEDGGDGGGGETAGAPAEGEGLPFPACDANRTGYWGFANLEPTVIDTFDRGDDPSSLGDAGTGQSWEAVSGTWGIEEDKAVTSGGARNTPNLAVIPEGRGDGLTEVTLTVVEEGAGLVFRYLDPENYWSVTANPGVGSWSVNRVIEGETELVSEIPGPTSDCITVSVTQDGSVVRVLLDGEEYLNVTDAALGQQLQGGVIAAPNTSGEARWDRFLVMRFRDGDGATTTTAG